MEKAEEIGAREAQQEHHQQQSISMQVTNMINARDLFNRSQQQKQSGEEEEETEEEIELSLGLSLNGRFGVDPTRDNKNTTNNKLMRSSSIPDFINPSARKDDNNSGGGNESGFVVPMSASAGNHLIRTCSLPTGTEEDWRKRKELQTLRRLEAKRKRSEKQRNLKIARQRSITRVGFGEENNCGGGGGEEVEFKVAAAGIVRTGGGGTCDAIEGALPPPPPPRSAVVATARSQGSNGSSQASGSSGISDFESQQPQGLNKSSEAISPSIQSIPNATHKLPPPHPDSAATEKPGQFVGVATENKPNEKGEPGKGVREAVRNMLEDMPCVSTKGDGPNGKRVEGFLYRYQKGEEVRIVCVCHGSFLSPAEFVKHAGGGEVAHPLKHIVVNPSPFL